MLIKKRIEIDWTAIQFRFGNRNTRTSPAQTIPNVTILCEVADIEPFQGQSDQIFQFLVEKHPIFFFFFFLRDRRINEETIYKNDSISTMKNLYCEKFILKFSPSHLSRPFSTRFNENEKDSMVECSVPQNK